MPDKIGKENTTVGAMARRMHGNHIELKSGDYECPLCAAMVPVISQAKYTLVECWNCKEELEFTGNEVISC